MGYYAKYFLQLHVNEISFTIAIKSFNHVHIWLKRNSVKYFKDTMYVTYDPT